MSSPSTPFETLLEYLKASRGFDFTGYKRPSLTRRIRKRMEVHGISDYDEYRAFLDEHEEEFVELFNTILINVTGFFRDPDAWDYLREEVVPQLVADGKEGPLRVWSTGCATGEEAYSIAIMLAEALGEEEFRRRVKIYATDVDEEALSTGRHGRYTAKQLEGLPTGLRDRYFERTDGAYSFRLDLRRGVIFGRHDLVQDPPISRIDLLVSRNTLMYFTPQAQTQILASFHFALREGRYLFLGKSEVLVSRLSLFMPVDLRRRVFVKVADGNGGTRTKRPVRQLPPRPVVELDELRAAVFDAVADPTLVVDRTGTLVLANTHARTLFGLQPKDVGRPLQDLELSYRPVELRSRIEEAYGDGHVVSVRDVEWRLRSGEVRVVDATVTPIRGDASELLGCVVTFSDVSRYRLLQRALQESKRDVEVAYEELQSAVEELETTNEEIQSANEELETTNEELQSANEELETTNEELQSTNEELEAMNDELRDRTDQLNDTNAFLESILGSIDAGVVVLDREFRIVAWNRSAFELWGLRSEEVVGTHFLNLDIGLTVEKLRIPFRETLKGEEMQRFSVSAVNRLGRTVECTLNVAPWQNAAKDVTGLIVMMEVGEQETP